ncbi:uncharacterized protein FIBRA_09097 [Fibroporia radiculosa]|uniref:Uncharacterized protein n=1 Tax=Fibroporia radiculosa TaxID=599839 RepID=J4I3T7_9APHY|nr:uncharacterized protein FIBRA_09097 [Fibroporia radiculosa]CCM06797.1 predicted protein [Fibroporia radiculosa]
MDKGYHQFLHLVNRVLDVLKDVVDCGLDQTLEGGGKVDHSQMLLLEVLDGGAKDEGDGESKGQDGKEGKEEAQKSSEEEAAVIYAALHWSG